jgi:tetratricopeptide (TPR) repeat protein
VDYQVRAFAAYQMGEIYFAQGDWWRWAGAPIYLDSDKSGLAVDTNWRYRLSTDQSAYYLPTGAKSDEILRMLNWTVEKDVTQNPEPLFFRGLVNARFGNLSQAEADSEYILKLEPDNPSYRALSAYVGALAGHPPQFTAFDGGMISDSRALSLLGEAAYLSGDAERARQYWVRSAKLYPLGASLAYLAGKKHLAWGHVRVGTALLMECIVMAPESKEAREARELPPHP